MNRRVFISNALLTGAAISLSGIGLDRLVVNPGTTLIGIGGAGIGLLGKVQQLYGNKLSYMGINTKGDWNEMSHHLIGFDYQRPFEYHLSKHSIVKFPEDDESIEQGWINNFPMLEPVFETGGKVIVLASLNRTMGGIVGNRIIREIVKRNQAEVTYLAIGPFSFERKKEGTKKEYTRSYETGCLCSRFEILSNEELLKPYNGQLIECFDRVDEKIVERIGQLV